ncbi:MAG: hypothetical protein WHT06_08575 [Desulfobacterales bacterium]
MQLYFRHLRPEGVLALHLSNHHPDLVCAAEALARDARKYAVPIENEPVEEEEIFGARRVPVSSTPLGDPGILEAAKAPAARQGLRIWTDDYSNLFTVFK